MVPKIPEALIEKGHKLRKCIEFTSGLNTLDGSQDCIQLKVKTSVSGLNSTILVTTCDFKKKYFYSQACEPIIGFIPYCQKIPPPAGNGRN